MGSLQEARALQQTNAKCRRLDGVNRAPPTAVKRSPPHPDNQSMQDYYAMYSKMPDAPRKQMHEGIVAGVASLQELEAIAQEPHVKGVCIERGPHPLVAEMDRWVSTQAEDEYNAFFHEKLMVAPEHEKPCTDEGCDHDHGHDHDGTMVGPDEVKAACARMASKLPAGPFREAVRADAEEMSFLMIKLNPEATWLAVQLEVVGRNRCSRWHQDNYVGRAILTYSGPSTWMADDSSVNFDQFRATMGVPEAVASPAIVPRFESIYMPPPNTIQLMKGNQWAGVANESGLIHKSPNVISDSSGTPLRNRFVLKVDMAYN